MLTIFVITIVRKELFEIILNNFLFFIQIISVRSWSMISSTVKTYLKTYLKRKEDRQRQKWWRREKFCALIFFWHSDFLYFPEPSGNFSKNSHNRDGFFFPPWDIIVPPANTRNSSCLPDCLQKSTTSRENPWLQSGGRCVCVCVGGRGGDLQTARDTATCDRNRGTKKDGWNTAVLMRCGNTAGHCDMLSLRARVPSMTV